MLALLAGLVAGCAPASDGGTTLTRSALVEPGPAPLAAASAAAPVTVPLPSTTLAPTPAPRPPSTTAAPPPAPTTAAPVTASVAPLVTAPAPPPPPPAPRSVHEQAWTPFASIEGVVLHHPSARVEAVGFHESNHDGARDLEPLSTAANPIVLESRERGTGARTAADVVSDPEAEIRAPVTGRVLRAGTYVLYCDHADDYAVIEPDARPGWEVKVLHIDGVTVAAGDRVLAGETVLARRPTQLPFDSQVDDHTASPAWPHVHLEVVDPSIPDRPSSGGGC